MKLTVLTDNVAGTQFLAEHGLSFLIKYEEEKILFDTGFSNVFLKNAERLGIKTQDEINMVALSHGHWDHGDGLQYLGKKALITHPQAFIKRFRKNSMLNIGLALTKSQIAKQFKLITTDKPYYINNNIIFLGSIPRLNNFEAQTTPFVDEKGMPDFVPDDSALAVIKNNQLIIITGCSHSGICNITDYAIQVTGINSVKAIIGGFHLKYNNEQTWETIKYFRMHGIEKLYPSHCTELPALATFYNKFKIEQIKTGITINL